uniref:Uncharacterized protein n=1 Tax=viral metagenome TaxID=1070528 RepID=A0A6C0FEK0_9ZZZZ
MDFEDYIDFNVLFLTMCILIFYRYITSDTNIILERRNKK